MEQNCPVVDAPVVATGVWCGVINREGKPCCHGHTREALNHAKDRLAPSIERARRAEVECDAMTKKVAELQKEVEEADKAAAARESQLTKDLDAKHAALEAATKTIAELHDKLAEANLRASTATTELETLREQLPAPEEKGEETADVPAADNQV